MRIVFTAVMGGFWFALVGCLAAAAPAMTLPQFVTSFAALTACGMWLVSFTSNR